MAQEFIIRKGFKSKADSELTGSLQITENLNIGGNVVATEYTGSFNGDGSGLTGITSTVPDGTVSGSSQIEFTEINNVPTTIISGSDQISGSFVNLSGDTMTGDLIITGSLNVTTDITNNGVHLSDGIAHRFITTGAANVLRTLDTDATAWAPNTPSNFFQFGRDSVIFSSWNGVVMDRIGFSTSALRISNEVYDTMPTPSEMLEIGGNVVGEGSITAISFSGSFSGSYVGDGSGLTGVGGALPPGVVSGSSQIDVTATTNYGSINQYTDSDNLDYLNTIGVQSGSEYVLPSNVVSGSSQIEFTEITNVPTTIVSGSSQISYNGITDISSGIISGSSQLDGTTINSLSGSFSGSFVGDGTGLTGITSTLPSGVVSGSSQISFTGITDKPTLVSGSDQVSGSFVQSNLTDEISGSDKITNMVSLTQAEFDAGAPNSTTYYVVTDAVSPDTLYEEIASSTHPLVSGSSQISFTGITDKPTLVSGSDQISGSFVQNNLVGEISGSDKVVNMVSLTQAEYDAGTPNADTYYLITDEAPFSGIVSGSDQVSGSFVNLDGDTMTGDLILSGSNTFYGSNLFVGAVDFNGNHLNEITALRGGSSNAVHIGFDTDVIDIVTNLQSNTDGDANIGTPTNRFNEVHALSFSGLFTGSYTGDGTNLTGITATLPNGVVSGSDQVSGSFIQSNLVGEISGSDKIRNMVSLTQAEYDAGTPNVDTTYIITDTPVIAGLVSGSSQINADTITNFDPNVLDYVNILGVTSGSDQVSGSFVQSNLTDEISGSDKIRNMVSLTQAEYDAGIPKSDTYYIITDEVLFSGIVSGSSQINYSEISNLGQEILTAGESVVSGDWCYLESDGKMWKTNASAESSSAGMIRVAVATIATDDSGSFQFSNKYVTSGLTAGSTYYLGVPTGSITETQPTASLAIVRPVGYAESTTVFNINISQQYIELA